MIERRDETMPAMDPRVGLAAERTLLAWVRTGLALMGFGFVVARFGLFLRELAAAGVAPPAPSSGVSVWIGSGMVILGVVVNLGAAVQHVRLLSQLERGEPYRPSVWSLGVAVTLLLAGIGLSMTAYLLAWTP